MQGFKIRIGVGGHINIQSITQGKNKNIRLPFQCSAQSLCSWLTFFLQKNLVQDSAWAKPMDGQNDLVWQILFPSVPLWREFAVFCDHQAATSIWMFVNDTDLNLSCYKEPFTVARIRCHITASLYMEVSNKLIKNIFEVLKCTFQTSDKKR